MILEHMQLMIDELFYSVLLILATIFIHATILHALIQAVAHIAPRRAVLRTPWVRGLATIGLVVMTVVGIFLSHTLHIWLWAFFYLFNHVPPITHLEEAVYFSSVTFSTLGYGDIVLAPYWRIMAGIQAANGMILFGWSVAVLFEIMALIYTKLDLRKLRLQENI